MCLFGSILLLFTATLTPINAFLLHGCYLPTLHCQTNMPYGMSGSGAAAVFHGDYNDNVSF